LDVNNPNTPVQVLKGHNKLITSLAYDQKNNHLFTGSYDAIINRWDVNTGASISFSGKGHTNQVTSIAVQGANLVTCGMDDSVRVTPLATKAYGNDKFATEGAPADVAVGHKSDLVVTATPSHIHVYRGGKEASKTPIKYNASAIAISNDESIVAVGGKDNLIHVYSLSGNTVTEKTALSGHKGQVTSLAFAPDGQHFCSADQGRDIFVWSISDWQIKIRDWVHHTARVNSIAWSPNSQYIASASLDQSIIVWSLKDPSSRITFKGAHQGGANRIVWLDDNTLATAGQDCFLKTWAIAF
jgi:WD40 repeat protein